MRHIAQGLLIGFMLQPAFAQGEPDHQASPAAARKFFDYLAQLNHYSPMEAAGSHGSYGTKLGIGVVNSSWDETSAYHKELLNVESEGQTSTNMAKLFVVKGTSWPMDFGLTLGNVPDTSVSQFGAHMHWAIIQGLGIPSVAVRANYSRILGMTDTSFESRGLDGVISYGLLRFFTFYAGAGGQLNTGRIHLSRNTELAIVENGEELKNVDANFYSAAQFLGLQVTFIPALCSATVEYTRNTKAFESIAGKLNVEI